VASDPKHSGVAAPLDPAQSAQPSRGIRWANSSQLFSRPRSFKHFDGAVWCSHWLSLAGGRGKRHHRADCKRHPGFSWSSGRLAFFGCYLLPHRGKISSEILLSRQYASPSTLILSLIVIVAATGIYLFLLSRILQLTVLRLCIRCLPMAPFNALLSRKSGWRAGRLAKLTQNGIHTVLSRQFCWSSDLSDRILHRTHPPQRDDRPTHHVDHGIRGSLIFGYVATLVRRSWRADVWVGAHYGTHLPVGGQNPRLPQPPFRYISRLFSLLGPKPNLDFYFLFRPPSRKCCFLPPATPPIQSSFPNISGNG